MNVLKKLIGGGSGGKSIKKKSNEHLNNNNNNDHEEYDYEADHCETDFDKHFEQARRSTSSSVPPPIVSQCEYRGSPSRATPTKSNRSKSPSPFAQQQLAQQQQQTLAKRSSAAATTPSTGRKSSEPNWTTAKQRGSPRGSPNPPSQLNPKAAEQEKMKRKLTESQQKQAKDIVESIDWIQSGPVVVQPQVCYSSSGAVQPQVVQSQMIVPQIHICEALPIVRPGKAMAVIPPVQHKKSLAQQQQPVMPVCASGKVVTSAVNNNRMP